MKLPRPTILFPIGTTILWLGVASEPEICSIGRVVEPQAHQVRAALRNCRISGLDPSSSSSRVPGRRGDLAVARIRTFPLRRAEAIRILYAPRLYTKEPTP